MRLVALEERLEADLELGGTRELVRELEGLVAGASAARAARGQLMLALYRSGRQAEALRPTSDARRALVEELGIDPSPALQQLYASILRQESRLSARRPSACGRRPLRLRAAEGGSFRARLVSLARRDATRAITPPSRRPPPPRARFDCPREHGRDLAQVSQYVALTQGVGPAVRRAARVFDRRLRAGAVHTWLAAAAGCCASGARRAAPRHDELRPRARAGVRRGRTRRSTSSLRRRRAAIAGGSSTRGPTAGDHGRVPNTYAELALERPPGDPQAARPGRPRPNATGELCRQRGRPHRLSRAGRARECRARDARREASPQPLPLPRLPASATGASACSCTACGGTSGPRTAPGRSAAAGRDDAAVLAARGVDIFDMPLGEYVGRAARR